MRKPSILLLSLLLITLLCGCQGEVQCEHQWTEADCLNPKTCTQCSETEGEALGHDFLAATCGSPETCSRCGLQQGQPLDHDWCSATCAAPETCTLCGSTQGEAVPHSFGKWEIKGEEMTRICSECGAQETVPLDREVYAMDQVIGHWDPYIISEGRNTIWAGTIWADYPVQYCIRVDGDGQIRLETSEDVLEGTLKFIGYNPENAAYTLEADLSADRSLTLILLEMDEGNQLQMLDGMRHVYFSQNESIRNYVPGIWAAVDDGIVRTLTLLEDGTFDYSGEFSGSWHLLYEEWNDWHCVDILLQYALNGETVADYLRVQIGQTNKPLEAVLNNPSPRGDMNMYQYSLEFTKMEPEKVARLKADTEAAQAEGREKLLGTWNSQAVGNFVYDGMKYTEQLNNSYSVTFREDGTFTARLDKEHTGIWKYTKVINDGGGGFNYYYELTYDDGSEAISLSAHFYEGSGLSLSEGYNGHSVTYEFQRSEDLATGQQMLCGSWASRSAEIVDSNGLVDEWNETGYSLTFHEDGTVSGIMEQAVSGIWVYTGKYSYEYPMGQMNTNYRYQIQFNAETGDILNAFVYPDGHLSVEQDNEDHTTRWAFSRSGG